MTIPCSIQGNATTQAFLATLNGKFSIDKGDITLKTGERKVISSIMTRKFLPITLDYFHHIIEGFLNV